jgi:hypothetical protein
MALGTYSLNCTNARDFLLEGRALSRPIIRDDTEVVPPDYKVVVDGASFETRRRIGSM